MNSFSTEAPASDVIEVSLFGPGKGESVVLHLGAGRWLVVDSCRNQRTGEVAATEYLRGIGVDIASDVRLVVATHAHDDHFAGIADIAEAAESALIVTSQALMNREFLALVVAEQEIAGITNTASYQEYRKIFEIAKKRKTAKNGRPLRKAFENRVLLDLPAVGMTPSAVVTALSPSDEAVTRATEALAKNYLHDMGERSRRATENPNEASIALWITVGGINILLGSDLENGPAGCGWSAVLDAFNPGSRSTLYKAAHHGSSTSHNDGLWNTLLDDDPTVLLTPFRNGGIDLPKDGDITYFLSHTSELWTTSPRMPTPSNAFKKQKAKLGTLARNPRDPYGLVGHLRARIPLAGGTWQVDNFAPAARLTSAAQGS